MNFFEKQEIYVIVDIPEYENSKLLESVENYSIVGIDTPHPLLTFDKKYFFKGEWIDYPATGLCFGRKKNTDPSTNENELSYECKTSKFLRFREIYIRKKKTNSETRRRSKMLDEENRVKKKKKMTDE